MPPWWLFWLVFLGPGAFVVSTFVALTAARRPSWLAWQVAVGIPLIVMVWQIGAWAGAYEDQDPEGCSDCGTKGAFALVAMFASSVGWAVGAGLGGLVRFVLRR